MENHTTSSRSRWQTLTAVLLGLYTLVLLTGTHLPVEKLPEVHTSDKLLHFVAYAGQAFWAGLFLFARQAWTWRNVVIWYGGLLVFAALDELTQPLVNRHADVLDWLADGVGLLIGFLLVLPVTWILAPPDCSTAED